MRCIKSVATGNSVVFCLFLVMWEQLMTFCGAALLLAFAPGPDNIYVLTQSVVNGVRTGIIITLGLVAGCLIHTTLVAFGIGALIHAFPYLLVIIKLIGASYMLFMAYAIFKNPPVINLKSEASKKTVSQLFKKGFILNVLNPKVTLFFIAFFPGFLWDIDNNTTLQFFILGGAFMIISFCVFLLFAVLAGSIAKGLSHNPKTALLFKWLQIVVFLGIGVFILL